MFTHTIILHLNLFSVVFWSIFSLYKSSTYWISVPAPYILFLWSQTKTKLDCLPLSSVKFFLNWATRNFFHGNGVLTVVFLLAELPTETLGFMWKVVFIPYVCVWRHIRVQSHYFCGPAHCTWDKFNLRVQLEEAHPKPVVLSFHLLMHVCTSCHYIYFFLRIQWTNTFSHFWCLPSHTHTWGVCEEEREIIGSYWCPFYTFWVVEIHPWIFKNLRAFTEISQEFLGFPHLGVSQLM